MPAVERFDVDEEREYTKSFDLVLKAEADLEEGHFEGHAAVFSNIDMQRDKILKGAFTNTIKETGGRWPVLNAHRLDSIIGFSTHAEEDAKGLLVRGELTLDSTAGKDAHAWMKHAAGCKQKLGLSIGYRIREDGADYDERAGIRLLKDLDVLEFSIAAVPANLRARVSRVKAGAWTEREFEQLLREAGHSREFAKRFVLGGFKSALEIQREADGSEGKNAGLMAELRQAEIAFNMKGLLNG